VKSRRKLICILGVSIISLVLVWIVFSSISVGPHTTSAPPNNTRLDKAVKYLKSHFNSTTGLIYESEDSGTRTIDGKTYRYSQIYWLYSDNLLATWALKPFAKQYSQRINETIQSFNQPPSRLFEVLFGNPIPYNISTQLQLIVNQYSDRVVMAEFHNSSTPLIWKNYADTLIYQSLNEHLKGNRTGAEYYFRQAYRMFDGRGVYDLAAQTDGRYANYKLALILYASKVLAAPYNVTSIEEKLWSMQQENGGITSLADLEGKPVGSTNAETTATALLPYNNELIARMRALFGAYTPQPETISLTLTYEHYVFSNTDSITSNVTEVSIPHPYNITITNTLQWSARCKTCLPPERAAIGFWEDMPKSPYPSFQVVLYNNGALDIVAHTTKHPQGIKIGGITSGWQNPTTVSVSEKGLTVKSGSIVILENYTAEFQPFRVGHITAGSTQKDEAASGLVKVEAQTRREDRLLCEIGFGGSLQTTRFLSEGHRYLNFRADEAPHRPRIGGGWVLVSNWR